MSKTALIICDCCGERRELDSVYATIGSPFSSSDGDWGGLRFGFSGYEIDLCSRCLAKACTALGIDPNRSRVEAEAVLSGGYIAGRSLRHPLGRAGVKPQHVKLVEDSKLGLTPEDLKELGEHSYLGMATGGPPSPDVACSLCGRPRSEHTS